MNEFALVLSGGGAKGAYQVGVIKALSEMGIKISAVSGASIGALNGAVVASSSSINQAYEKLNTIWQTLGDENLFKIGENLPKSIIKLIPQIALLVSGGGTLTKIIKLLSIANINTYPVVFDDSLTGILKKNLDFDFISNEGIPFYVSVFKNNDYLKSLFLVLRAELLGIENSLSDFEHIQSLTKEQQHQYILASATIPFIFKAQEGKDGDMLTDGGQGGWISAQGNTPITPLLDAGYKKIIVTHLSNDSLWNRHDFDAEIYEIRPSINLNIKQMLKFDDEYINELIHAGYEDTKKQIGRILKALDTVKKFEAAPRVDLDRVKKISRDTDDILDLLNKNL